MSIECDVCGCNLKDDGGFANAAIVIRLLGHPEQERVKEVFGKTKFKICHVCQLKSLGVKQKKPHKAG